MEYFVSRGKDDKESLQIINQAQSDMSIIDCLSTPLSIACLCFKAGIDVTMALDAINIVCIGTSSKAEGRICRETNCFHEISYIFENIKRINVHFVGPEMIETSSAPKQVKNNNLYVSEFRGTSKDFFRANPDLLLGNSTVVFGINCGFGNWENPGPARFSLLMQWLPDLYFLTGTKMPLFFTCANDYADLSGEVALMQHIMGSTFIVPPGRNPFSFASTLVPPGKESSTNDKDYSCGNSFFYGVQGHDKSRRKTIATGDIRALIMTLKTPMLPIAAITKPLLPFGNVALVVDDNNNGTDESDKEAKLYTSNNNKPIASGQDDEVAKLLESKAVAQMLQREREVALEESRKAELEAAAKLEETRKEAEVSTSRDVEMLRKGSVDNNMDCTGQTVQICDRSDDGSQELSKESIHEHCSVAQNTMAGECGSRVLHVRIKFNVHIESPNDLEVDVNNESKILRLGIKRCDSSVEHVIVPLLCRINVDKMKAKFSKKKLELSLKADIFSN